MYHGGPPTTQTGFTKTELLVDIPVALNSHCNQIGCGEPLAFAHSDIYSDLAREACMFYNTIATVPETTT